MATDTLVLHRGAREVTIEEVQAVPTPAATHSWFPVPHVNVLEGIEGSLVDAGYAITNRRLALSSNNNQFFGTLTLASAVGNGVSLAVGVRNSIDKSLPLGFCAGNRVFVCDNLSFRSELNVARKHTRHGNERFDNAIKLAVSALDNFKALEERRYTQMISGEITDERASHLILQALSKDIISSRRVAAVYNEWLQPRHQDFAPRTTWSLFNAFTEVLKETQSNPREFAIRTFNLNALLCPPNEGDIVYDTTFTED